MYVRRTQRTHACVTTNKESKKTNKKTVGGSGATLVCGAIAVECNPIGMRVCASAQRRSWQKCARHRQAGWCVREAMRVVQHTTRRYETGAKRSQQQVLAGQDQDNDPTNCRQSPRTLSKSGQGLPRPDPWARVTCQGRSFPFSRNFILFIYLVFFPQPHQVPFRSAASWWWWRWWHWQGRWWWRLMILGAEGRKPLRLHSTAGNAHTVPGLKLALQNSINHGKSGQANRAMASACDNASCKPHPSFIHFPLLVLMLIDASEAEERSNDTGLFWTLGRRA